MGNPRTRRPALWILGAVLAASATLVITLASGEADANNAMDLSGEDMNITPIGAGEVGWDPTVGGHMSIWSNAEVTGTVVTTEPVGEVVLHTRGDQCEGVPRVAVVIDGTEVMSEAVESTVWTDYVARTSLPAGMHTVEIHYPNDHYVDPSCDRNLMVDTVSLVPESASGALRFADGFNREADIFVHRWDAVIWAAGNRISTSTNYVRAGSHSARFTVLDGDTAPLTPNENPRAQLNKVALFCEGDERWIGWSMYFPNNFAHLPPYGWVNVGSLGKAPPYNEDAPFSINVDGGSAEIADRIYISRDSSYGKHQYGQRVIWTQRIRRGIWYDWIFHVNFSRKGDKGSVEIWKNGHKQKLSNGRTKLFYRTLKRETNPRCGNLQVANYRKKGMLDRLTMYHDEIKVGTSRAAVIR
jgi:hypothetical protein